MKLSSFIFILFFSSSCTPLKNYLLGKSSEEELVVVSKNSPTTYYYDRYNEESGFEFDLAKSFAESTGRRLKIISVGNLKEMMAYIESGKADFIASGISKTKTRVEQGWRFGPVYATTTELLICRKGVKIVARRESSYLGKKLVVVGGSSYVKSLESAGYDLKFWKKEDTNTEELLERLENQEIDCTISDEHIFKMQKKFTENLISLGPISPKQNLAWVLNPEKPELKKQLEKWMFDFLERGALEAVYEKYYGYSQYNFNRFDSQIFRKRISERLPKYIEAFKVSGKNYDIPWELIAAVSYQESHWDETAVSPTGVRGLMMLTRSTAKLMRVNRLNAIQSIDGGVRYLKSLRDGLPKSIKEPDRTWISLAAYNVGLGHIYDVRQLIRQSKGNPDSWKEIKFYLPFLSKEKVYRNLKYGYARGNEPVKYVRRIRTYYEILKKLDEKKIRSSSEEAL